MEEASVRFLKSKGSSVAAAVIGGALLLILVGLVFLFSEFSSDQRALVRFLMALCAGFLSYYFAGGILLKGKRAGQTISATGGFALFVLIQFVVDPFTIQTAAADAGLSRSDDRLKNVQLLLQQEGVYDGPINGKPTSETRKAIRSIQRDNGLEVSGYLNPETVRTLNN